MQRVLQNSQFLPGRGGKLCAACVQLFGALGEVDGVIADTLKFGEALEIVVQKDAVVIGLHVAGQAHQIVVDRVGQHVDRLLIFLHGLDDGAVIRAERAQRAVRSCTGRARHRGNGFVRAGKRQLRRGEELIVEQLKLVLDALRMAHIVMDDNAAELFVQAAERQQEHRAGQIEQRVRVRDAAGGDRRGPDAVQRPGAVQDVDRREDQHGLAEVEKDVHHAGALGVGLRADGADDGRRDAVTEVDADEDRIDRTERQLPRDGQRL